MSWGHMTPHGRSRQKEKASGIGLGKKDEPKTDKVIDGDLIVARARCM